MAKHKNALLLRQRPRLNHHTFFILLLGIAFTLGGMILDIRSAYALNPGDIAILGVRADDIDGTAGNGNDDAFAWVPLVNLAPGAEIFFTDAGWTAANTFRAQEGAIKYTAPAGGLAAGTVMLLELTRDGSGAYIFTPSGGGGTYSNANDIFVGTTGFLTAASGDQVFIFEGSTAAPVFIWGWKNEGPFDADATSNDTSALPPGLTAGVNALAVGNGASTDNNRYVGTSSGTALALAAAIADPANWETIESLPFSGGGNDITNGTSSAGFTVGPSNTAPTITSGNTASVAENQTSAIDVEAADDSDAEGSGLTFSKTGGADQALFTLNAGNGVITFITAPDFETPGDAGADNNYDIQVTVTDSGGLMTVQNIVITVTDVAENTAPVLGSIGNQWVDEGQPLMFTVTALDSDGDNLSYAMGNIPTGAVFTDNGDGTATFRWTPDFGQAGNFPNVLFSVADDGVPSASDSETIAITVGDVNRPPVLNPIGDRMVAEGELLEFTLTATDPDGDNLRYTMGNAPTGVIPTDNGDGTATFRWTPDFAQAGNFPNVLFTVTDDGAPPTSDSETITITVGDVNRPPVLNPIGDRMVAEGELLEFTLTATDPDGDNLRYAMGNAPAGAAFTDNGDGTGTLRWTPDFAQAGNFPGVLFSVTDDGVPSTSDSETVTITVGDVNRPPVLSPMGDRTVAEGELLEFTLTAADPDGDSLSYVIDSIPTGATFADNGDGTAVFRWTPGFGQAGNFPDVLFTVIDDGAPPTSDAEAITITVGDVNRPPVLSPMGDRAVTEGELLEFTLTAADPDGDGLNYAIDNMPAGATFADNGDGTAVFRWTPGFGQAGSFPDVLFMVTDEGALSASDSETITITVSSENSVSVGTGGVGAVAPWWLLVLAAVWGLVRVFLNSLWVRQRVFGRNKASPSAFSQKEAST